MAEDRLRHIRLQVPEVTRLTSTHCTDRSSSRPQVPSGGFFFSILQVWAQVWGVPVGHSRYILQNIALNLCSESQSFDSQIKITLDADDVQRCKFKRVRLVKVFRTRRSLSASSTTDDVGDSEPNPLVQAHRYQWQHGNFPSSQAVDEQTSRSLSTSKRTPVVRLTSPQCR
jgi:hypothetical protein